MSLYAILAIAGGLLATFLGLRHRARVAEAKVAKVAVERDVARGQAEVAIDTVIVSAQVAEDKDAGHVNAGKVEVAAVGEHPERAAERERQRLHDENAASVRAKIARGR